MDMLHGVYLAEHLLGVPAEVVVSPQQCGEHGRFADLGLAGPGEQCQPPVLCKSAQV